MSLGLGYNSVSSAQLRPSLNDYDRVSRALKFMDGAVNNNPYDLPVHPTATVAVSTSSDGTLAAAVPVASGTSFTTAGLTNVAWYGGIPKVVVANYVATAVVDETPGTGNLSSLANVNVTSAMSGFNHAEEVVTDSDVIEFAYYCRTGRTMLFQVDGQYISKTGLAGASASNAPNYFKLSLPNPGRPKVVRAIGSNNLPNADSPSMLLSIRVNATYSFWKPPQDRVLKLNYHGDSYSVGAGTQNQWTIGNATVSTLMGELLGFRDTRQMGIFGTGYLATGTGRAKLGDQLTRQIIIDQYATPPDLVVIAHGYNDQGQNAAALQAEVVTDLAAIRALAPKAPIVVFGASAGATGPSAAILAVETAIQAAVTQYGDPLCKFASHSSDPAGSILNGTGYSGATNGTGNSDRLIGTDHIHPITLGHEYLAYRQASKVRDAVRSMLA